MSLITPKILFILILLGGLDFADIIERIESHFKIPFHPSDFLITAELIHTYCIYYDMYDSSDYTNYFVIQLKG